MIPFFSIIIPLYNKENFIQETLRSVLNQSFKDFEIILVNDGSTDRSLEKVTLIKDPRIKFYSIKNSGVSFARNYGIKQANANYIVFLDADDFWFPNHLQTLEALSKKFPDCGLYANAYEKKHLNTTIKSIYKKIPNDNNWMGIVDDFFESSVVNSIAWTSAVMVPKKVITKIGFFDEKITLGAGEDTDLWIRIALNYPIAFCNTVTAIHNLHADNRISNSNTNLRKFLNLDQYEKYTKNNEHLKNFLDFNRYAIAIQYKLARNEKTAKSYIEKINPSRLNWKQRSLLKMNYPSLVLFFKLKNSFKYFGINLSAFK